MSREKENKGLLERIIIGLLLFACAAILLFFILGFLGVITLNFVDCPEINTTTENVTCEPVTLYEYTYIFPGSQLPEIKCEVCKCQN